MREFLSGAIFAGFATAGLFFFRFWKATRDRFFATFAIAFLVLALERFLSIGMTGWEEPKTWLFIVRLSGFLLIFTAILQKNASHSNPS